MDPEELERLGNEVWEFVYELLEAEGHDTETAGETAEATSERFKTKLTELSSE